MDICAVVMAAGNGTRMKSAHSKVVHQVAGKPIVQWVADALCEKGLLNESVTLSGTSYSVNDVFLFTLDGAIMLFLFPTSRVTVSSSWKMDGLGNVIHIPRRVRGVGWLRVENPWRDEGPEDCGWDPANDGSR